MLNVKIKNIRTFLLNMDWKETKNNNKFYNFIPPQKLKFPNEYYLSIPKTIDAPDFDRFINRVIELLSNIYDIAFDDLLDS